MKCHTIDCARNTFLLLQKHLTSGTELILTGWKIVPNEKHVQCDHCFASQSLANEPLHSSQLFDTSLVLAVVHKPNLMRWFNDKWTNNFSRSYLINKHKSSGS